MHYNPYVVPIAKEGNRDYPPNQYYQFYQLPIIMHYLYPYVYDLDNILEAFFDCFITTTKSFEMLEAKRYFYDFIHDIQTALITKNFIPEPPHVFKVKDPKERVIKAPRFKTRVIQKALIQVVGPFLDGSAIPFSYANIPERGTLNIKRKVYEILQICPLVLVMDVHHFFPSINNTYLRCMLYDLIKDPDLYYMLSSCVPKAPIGIDIGSITSQYFANLYLDPLDKLVCYTLGNTNYCRYMDDFLIGVNSMEEANFTFHLVNEFLNSVLEVALNTNSRIIRSNDEFEFVGFRYKDKIPYMKDMRLENALNAIKEFSVLGYGIDMYPYLLRDYVLNYIINAYTYTADYNGIKTVIKALHDIGINDCLLKKDKLNIVSV